MSNLFSLFILPAGGIVIGVIATVIVGRYYYQRTIEKKLTAYVYNFSPIFSGIDQAVRQNLKILYREQEVEHLTELQFIIANDGQRAIRDCIKPLRIGLPNNASLLDANILYKNPPELDISVVSIEHSGQTSAIELIFPLLNRGDFFLLKLLTKGSAEPMSFEFSILVDDIPPTMKPVLMPLSTEDSPSMKVEWPAITIGIGFISYAFVSGYIAYNLWTAKPEFFPYPWSTFQLSWTTLLIMPIFLFSSLMILIAGFFLCFDIGFDETFKKRAHFPLPEKYRVQRPSIALEMDSRRVTASEIERISAPTNNLPAPPPIGEIVATKDDRA